MLFCNIWGNSFSLIGAGKRTTLGNFLGMLGSEISDPGPHPVHLAKGTHLRSPLLRCRVTAE